MSPPKFGGYGLTGEDLDYKFRFWAQKLYKMNIWIIFWCNEITILMGISLGFSGLPMAPTHTISLQLRLRLRFLMLASMLWSKEHLTLQKDQWFLPCDKRTLASDCGSVCLRCVRPKNVSACILADFAEICNSNRDDSQLRFRCSQNGAFENLSVLKRRVPKTLAFAFGLRLRSKTRCFKTRVLGRRLPKWKAPREVAI